MRKVVIYVRRSDDEQMPNCPGAQVAAVRRKFDELGIRHEDAIVVADTRPVPFPAREGYRRLCEMADDDEIGVLGFTVTPRLGWASGQFSGLAIMPGSEPRLTRRTRATCSGGSMTATSGIAF